MRARVFLLLYLYIALTPVQVREELARLPELISHFTLHQSEDPRTGIVKFLSQHYGEDFALHQSAHDHSGLPGKNQHSHDCSCTTGMAQLAPLLTATLLPSSLEWKRTHHFPEEDLLPSSHPDNIWQPPRMA